WARPMLGYAYALAGQPAEALPLLEPTVTVPLYLESFLARLRAEGFLLTGHLAAATDLAQHALAVARQRQERGLEGWGLHLLGEIAAHAESPEVEQAERYYREALALAEELGMRPLAAHCHLGLGTLYQRVGREEQARAELTTAAEMYRAMEMPFWLAKAEAAFAQVGV